MSQVNVKVGHRPPNMPKRVDAGSKKAKTWINPQVTDVSFASPYLVDMSAEALSPSIAAGRNQVKAYLSDETLASLKCVESSLGNAVDFNQLVHRGFNLVKDGKVPFGATVPVAKLRDRNSNIIDVKPDMDTLKELLSIGKPNAATRLIEIGITSYLDGK